MKKEFDLTKGNIPSALTAFIVPMILGSLIQQLYTTADAVIVGQFAGKAGLAAIDSVHTLFKFPINFMNGLSAGATILISGYYGAKDEKSLRCCVRTANTLALVLGVICAIAGVLFTPQLLDIMAVPQDIYPQTLIYCRIYFGGIWAMVLYNMMSGILRSFGDSRRPLAVLIFSSLVNIVGDYLLVGIFRMGVQGAAIATIAAQMVSVLLVSRMLQKMKHISEGKPVIHVHFCAEHMSIMVKTGIPLALQAILFPIANSIVQASVNGMGTDSIAAWGICDKMNLLIWLIADAMSPALTTYTAQNLGAKQMGRVKKGVFFGTGISVGAVALVSLVLYLGAGIIGSWFVPSSDRAAVIPLVIQYTRMMAPFFIFYAMAEAFSGACCGMGDTLKPMVTTLVTVCLLRVVCIFFVLPGFRTMECIVYIYIASWIAAGMAFTGMYMWKQKKLGFHSDVSET
ncbi:MAG: MATE family efflux transporter [Lachnospiraceae bacterium]|nr:MATE family efflux transporter [Lachnospiraceae bacterium]